MAWFGRWGVLVLVDRGVRGRLVRAGTGAYGSLPTFTAVKGAHTKLGRCWDEVFNKSMFNN